MKNCLSVVASIILISLSAEAKPLLTFSGLRAAEIAEWADGDSFPLNYIHPETKEKTTSVFRLYYVDTLETAGTTNADVDRMNDQKNYFALPNKKLVIDFGKLATKRTHQLLEKPFTIHSSFANALGRSKNQRYYAMITLSDGRDLASVLVEEGLARVKGTARKMPTGVSAEDYREGLFDKELVAAMSSKGIWAASQTEELVKRRELVRLEAARKKHELSEVRQLQNIDPAKPLDLNTASAHSLKKIKGIGTATATKIIQNRPFSSVKDLYNIKNLHRSQIDKYIHLLYVPEEQPQ